MAPRLQIYHEWLLAGPPIGLLSSSPLIMTHGPQGVSSNHLLGRVCKLAIRWSQLPGRAPQISSVISLGFPSFSNSWSTEAPDLLPYNVYPCVDGHNIFAANLLTFADFL